MRDAGVGRGYETTMFDEDTANGSRRIAVFVFWRGGGFNPADRSGGMRGISVGVAGFGRRSSLRWRLTLPLRYLLLAIFFPIAWVADRILAYRARRRRKPFVFVPMSVAVQEARAYARYEAGVLQINARKIPVPHHSTLVVFVEDDPSQDDDVAVTTHLIATEAFIPGPAIDAADRERLRATRDPELMREVARKLHMKHVRGPGQMFLAIHEDPVCREFIRRAAVDPF